jgi:hypothetical protein
MWAVAPKEKKNSTRILMFTEKLVAVTLKLGA